MKAILCGTKTEIVPRVLKYALINLDAKKYKMRFFGSSPNSTPRNGEPQSEGRI
jgi:hypothetical protein